MIYIAALNFLSEKFNIKTSQDWHLIFFFSLKAGQILLVLCILSNSGLYLEYFEYYSVRLWLLKFSGKMYFVLVGN